MNIRKLIGEATAYDKKQQLEVKRPKSWLKSVSAFANGEGGTLVFGINDDDQVVGLADAESDAERISEEIKTKLDPIPAINLEFKEVKAKKLLRELYEYYNEHIDALPENYFNRIWGMDEPVNIVVCDYIAGMSDQYVVHKFEEIFVPRSWTYKE